MTRRSSSRTFGSWTKRKQNPTTWLRSPAAKDGDDVDDNETDDEEYIYLADGDLDAIYEENDVQMALDALKHQRLAEDSFPLNLGKEKGKASIECTSSS